MIDINIVKRRISTSLQRLGGPTLQCCQGLVDMMVTSGHHCSLQIPVNQPLYFDLKSPPIDGQTDVRLFSYGSTSNWILYWWWSLIVLRLSGAVHQSLLQGWTNQQTAAALRAMLPKILLDVERGILLLGNIQESCEPWNPSWNGKMGQRISMVVMVVHSQYISASNTHNSSSQRMWMVNCANVCRWWFMMTDSNL